MPRARTLNCGSCGAPKVLLASGASRCLDCHNRRGREYYRNSAVRREKQRRSYILRKYGLSLHDLEKLLEGQDGRCAICRTPWEECVSAKRTRFETRFLQYLCVDHDHASGCVRGLLCNGCNAAIGMFKEDCARFQAAADYLTKNAGIQQ